MKFIAAAHPLPPIDVDASPNPFPCLRSIADEQEARRTALEAELESLLTELRAVRVEVLTSGVHDQNLRRLGAMRVELRTLAGRGLRP